MSVSPVFNIERLPAPDAPSGREVTPPTVKVPLTSNVPFKSIAVAFNSISSVALMSNTVALGAPMF